MLKIEKMFDHGTLELKPEKEIIDGSEHTLRRVTVKFVLQFRHSSTSSSSCQRTSVSAARIFSSSTLKNFICFNFSKFLQAYQLTCNDWDSRTKSFCVASLSAKSCCNTHTLFLSSACWRSSFSWKRFFSELKIRPIKTYQKAHATSRHSHLIQWAQLVGRVVPMIPYSIRSLSFHMHLSDSTVSIVHSLVF